MQVLHRDRRREGGRAGYTNRQAVACVDLRPETRLLGFTTLHAPNFDCAYGAMQNERSSKGQNNACWSKAGEELRIQRE